MSQDVFPLLGSGLPASHLLAAQPYAEVCPLGVKLCNYLAVRDPIGEMPDALLALGSDFEEVAYQAATLAHLLKPQVVVCAGGRGRRTPSAWESEARWFADILIAQGITPEIVLIDDKSTNTGENLRCAHQLLEAHGVSPRSLLITLDPLLQLRAALTAHVEWPRGVTIRSWAAFMPDFTRPHPGWPLGEWRRRLLWESIGEIYRLIEYQKPEKGFIMPVEIPGDILSTASQVGRVLQQDSSIPPEQRDTLASMLETIEGPL